MLDTGNYASNQFRTSIPEPTDGASGSIANPGTKKTGNHLAKRAEPGLRLAKMESPSPGLTNSAKNMKNNSAMHPPNIAGKLISWDLRTLFVTLSTRVKITAPVRASF